MREILFRGKVIGGEEFIYGDYIRATPIPLIRVTEDDRSAYFGVIPETVGQYTGLTDKNGKKIFEGDIVDFDYIGKGLGFDGVSVVIFENGQFGVKWGNHKEFVSLVGFANTTITVIGNIHDNPEFLKGGENG